MSKFNLSFKKHLAKKPVVSPLIDNRPTIEEVFEVFQQYQDGMVQLTRKQQSDWPSAIEHRRRVLYARLKNMGLAESIRWNFKGE